MKVIGVKIINDVEVPMIVECTSMEVSGGGGWPEKFDPDHCRILMRTAHPAQSYFIIKTEREDTGNPQVKPYKWLTKKEAEDIMICATEFDVIDLRKFGNLQICSQTQIQSVFIMNDINEWTEEDEPILVKIVSDSDNK